MRLKSIEACSAQVVDVALVVHRALGRGKKVLLFGNGGSAADAQHAAAELVGRFQRDRRGLPAIALAVDGASVTAIGNDFGFDAVFARQLEALGRPGDVAVALSTTGSSPNVLEGVVAARRLGLSIVGLIGEQGTELARLVDVALIVPSQYVPYIQECHIAFLHGICAIVAELERAESDEAPADLRDPHSALRDPCSVLRDPPSKIVNLSDLLALRERFRLEKKTVVWTNGCFDLLHPGHVRSLQSAKALGDVLVVGVNEDKSVTALKGPARPVLPCSARAEVLAALECVDYVISFHDLTPESIIEKLRPDVHCKGDDYASGKKPVPEAELVKSYGGRIAYLPLVEGFSTTELVARLRDGEES